VRLEGLKAPDCPTTRSEILLKRFGFHCFRHTLASFLLAEGNNPVLIKNLLRWSKISMLDVYEHVMTDEKIAAQGSMIERIMPNGCRAINGC
jgi:integrase